MEATNHKRMGRYHYDGGSEHVYAWVCMRTLRDKGVHLQLVPWDCCGSTTAAFRAEARLCRNVLSFGSL